MALVPYSGAVYVPSVSKTTSLDIVEGYRHVPFVQARDRTVTHYIHRVGTGRLTQHYGSYAQGLAQFAGYQYGQSFIGITSNTEMTALRNELRNRARDKLRDEWMGSASQIAASFGEGQSTLGMMADRLVQIRRSYQKLRRGDVVGAVKGLNPLLPVQQSHRSMPRSKVARQASSLWLEYWLGWSPLIQEIYNGAEILSRPSPKEIKAVVKSSMTHQKSYFTGTTTNYDSWAYQARVSCKTGMVVRVTNPNALLLNQLGLVNPAAVAWELVPFSFIVDWFVNVQQFIASVDEFFGCEVLFPYYVETWRTLPTASKWQKRQPSFSYTLDNCNLFFIRRYAGLPQITLGLKTFKGLSITRAATAASLVVALFAGKSR